MKAYIGVAGAAKSASKMYVGVDDRAKNVVKGYIGDSGCRAKLFFDTTPTPTPPVPPEPEPEPTEYTFAGRKIYRHATLPGSVIEYNEFGKNKKLFVVDNIYRTSTGRWKESNTAVSGLNNWPNIYYPVRPTNVINERLERVDLKVVKDLSIYESKLTDAYFQAALTATLKPVLQTAKAATDLMIADGNCLAARLCRRISVGVELQIPNIYQLLVMYACGDYVDKLDPTLESGSFPLGYNEKQGGRFEAAYMIHSWSSTQWDAEGVCAMYYEGGIEFQRKLLSSAYFGNALLPVAEL